MDKEQKNLPSTSSLPLTNIARIAGLTRGGKLLRPSDLLKPSTKKTFVPNIPQRRVQVKEEVKSSSSPETRKDSVRGRDDKRGRGRGRGRKEYVQVEGALFGQGPAIESSRKASRDYSSRERAAPAIPTYKPIKKKTKEEMSEEQEKTAKLLEDSFVDDDSDEECNYKPILLPLTTDYEQKFKTERQNIKTEVKVKSEIKTEVKEEIDMITEEVKKILGDDETDDKKFIKSIKTEMKEEKKPCINEFLSKIKGKKAGDGAMAFLQLPNCLPISCIDKTSIKTNVPKKSEETGKNDGATDGSSSSANGTQAEDEVNSLSTLKEGKIGKLQILRSGEMRLVLGSVTMRVEWGTPISFLQDLVTIKSDGEKTNVAVLGHVNQHLICSPMTENLL